MKFQFDGFVVDSEKEPYKTEGFRVGFYGGPGSGKSYTAATMVEAFLDQKGTVVIFEPKSEWHTLKERYGEVSVVGGPYQDVPMVIEEADIYASAVVNNGASMVFDYAEVLDDEALVKFAARLIKKILALENVVRRPILFVVEEAHEYSPLHPSGREVPPWVFNTMTKQIKNCSTQGRKLGIAMILISQRPAELNYTVRMMCNLNFYGKFHPRDLEDVKSCLKPYKQLKIIEDLKVANELIGVKPGNWLTFTSTTAEMIKTTAKRKTPHGADTPTLEYQAPPPKEIKETVSNLTQELQRLLEKRKEEKGEIASLKAKLKRRDGKIERLEKRVEMKRVFQEMAQAMRDEGSGVSPEIMEKLESLEELETEKRQLEDQFDQLRHQAEERSGELEEAKGRLAEATDQIAELENDLAGFTRLKAALLEVIGPIEGGVAPAPSIDRESIVQEVMSRLPEGGGLVYKPIPPKEFILKETLQTETQRFIDMIGAFPHPALKVLRYLAAVRHSSRPEIHEKVFQGSRKSLSKGGAFVTKWQREKLQPLLDRELVIYTPRQGKVDYNLDKKIREDIAVLQPTEVEVENVIARVEYSFIGEG